MYHTLPLKQIRLFTGGARGYHGIRFRGYNDYKRLSKHVNTASVEHGYETLSLIKTQKENKESLKRNRLIFLHVYFSSYHVLPYSRLVCVYIYTHEKKAKSLQYNGQSCQFNLKATN